MKCTLKQAVAYESSFLFHRFNGEHKIQTKQILASNKNARNVKVFFA